MPEVTADPEIKTRSYWDKEGVHVTYYLNGEATSLDQLLKTLNYSSEEEFHSDQSIKSYKRHVFKSLDASGGIDHYSGSLGYKTEEDFLNDITGKVILDLGSGKGILARESYLRGIKSKIISVEPKLKYGSDEDYEGKKAIYDKESAHQLNGYNNTQHPESLLTRFRRWVTRAPKPTQPTELANRSHNSTALAAFAQALPFPNDIFDRIFDVTAVSRYMGSREGHGGHGNRPFYEQYLTETVRVLRPGGEMRVFDDGFGWIESGYQKEPSWKEQTLKDLRIDYQIIWENPEDKSGPLGVKIFKPKSP